MLYGRLLSDAHLSDGRLLGREGAFVEMTDEVRLHLLRRDVSVEITDRLPDGAVLVSVPSVERRGTDRMMRGGVEA